MRAAQLSLHIVDLKYRLKQDLMRLPRRIIHYQTINKEGLVQIMYITMVGISKKVGGSSKPSSLDSAISSQALTFRVSLSFTSTPFLRYSLRHSLKKLLDSVNLLSLRYRNPSEPKTIAVSRVDSVVLLERNPSFVLSLNLSSVFKFNLSRAKQSLPKISTKFLSVRPSVRLSVCLSVCPENQTLFRWRKNLVGTIILPSSTIKFTSQ